ncbi:MAG TPA: hypothetical protein VGL59_10680 [Polyangia bacterium]|jgi:hypothetical protein
MAGSEQRPAEVPAAAVWVEKANEWQVSDTDDQGRRHGLTRGWRGDGTLRSETTYRGDAAEGIARLYHPDGSLARETPYEGGKPHGTVTVHGCDAPTTEPLQVCCVPMGAWRMQLDYDQGSFVEQRWYDRSGAHILPSGKPFPPRPSSVIAAARFDEHSDRWLVGAYTENAHAHGVWMRWARDGVLLERDEYDTGLAQGLWQRFRADGTLLEESWFRAGKRDGVYRRTNLSPGIFTNSRITEERGAFDRDQAVGPWTLHDENGTEVRRLNLGVAGTKEELAQSPALAAEPPVSADPAATDTDRWLALADTLESQGRTGESVLAAARAASDARSADELRLRLSGLQLPLTNQAASELAVEMMKVANGELPLLANGFGRGGHAPQLLRAIAAARDGADDVSMDLVSAALLLDPTLHEGKVTRALLELHRGHPIAARIDAESLPAEWEEQRAFLLGYGRALFPVFDFWPARRTIETLYSEVPDKPDQDLAAVRATIQKFATRLMAIRQATAELLRADGKHPRPWLLPDLSALLPDGPVALEQWEFEEIVVDDEEDGATAAAKPATAEPQPTLVKVDEQLPLARDSLPSLMRAARREWNSLCWLCWSAGLNRIALPTELNPPATFGQAAAMTVQHLWRCRDKITTSGLRALTQNIPGFEWEGTAIDAMSPVLVEIATLEYLEQRALFFWLCDSGVQSPWQDNLRSQT